MSVLSKKTKKKKERNISVFRDYVESIVTAIILALIFQVFIIQTSKVPTGSMLNTIQLGDKLFFLRYIYNKGIFPLYHRDIQRQEIVVFKFPEDPKKDFIKRAIGLPGDRIKLVGGRVYVNGELLEEPYVVHDSPDNVLSLKLRGKDIENVAEFTVPEGKYFVMGDNRDTSYDSRFWGFVDRKLIKGRGFMIYWSYDGKAGSIRWDRILKLLR